MSFNWPAEVIWERVDASTLQCRCVFLHRKMPEQFSGIKIPKRPLVDSPSLRDLAFRFLARGQR